MKAPRYRLGNQVVLVHGKHASALYDLFGGRIQRVSSGLGELLSFDVARAWHDAPGADGGLAQLFAKLAARGFLEESKENGAKDYSFEHAAPRFPPIRTISFEVGRHTGQGDLGQAEKLILEAVDGFSLGSFAFLVRAGFGLPDELERLARDLLGRAKYVLCEFWGEDQGVIEKLRSGAASAGNEGRVFASAICTHAKSSTGLSDDGHRFVWGLDSALSASALICRPDFYHLLMSRSESFGCLHFDEKWRIFPDVSESNHQIGFATAYSGVGNLLADAGLNGYWNFGKDRREKCRDCELRYACPNPLSTRSRHRDLASSPANCSYSPERGTW